MDKFKLNFKVNDRKKIESEKFYIESYSNTEDFAIKGENSDQYMICLNEDGSFTANYSSEYSYDDFTEIFKTVKECLDYLSNI